MVQVLRNKPEVGTFCGNRFSGHIDKKAMRDAFYFGNRLIAFSHSLLNRVILVWSTNRITRYVNSNSQELGFKSKGFDIEVELNCRVDR